MYIAPFSPYPPPNFNSLSQSPALSTMACLPSCSINSLHEISNISTMTETPLNRRNVTASPPAKNFFPTERQDKINQEMAVAYPHFLSLWSPELNCELKALITHLQVKDIIIDPSLYPLIRANKTNKQAIDFIRKCISVIQNDSHNTIKNTQELSNLFLSTDNFYDHNLIQAFIETSNSWIEIICSSGFIYDNLKKMKYRGFPTLKTLSQQPNISQPDSVKESLKGSVKSSLCAETDDNIYPLMHTSPPQGTADEHNSALVLPHTMQEAPQTNSVVSILSTTGDTPILGDTAQNSPDIPGITISTPLTSLTRPDTAPQPFKLIKKYDRRIISRISSNKTYLKKHKRSKLNESQKNELVQIYMNSKPEDHQISGSEWNAKTMGELCKQYFKVEYTMGAMYEVLHTIQYFSEIDRIPGLQDRQLTIVQKTQLKESLKTTLPESKNRALTKWSSLNVSILITETFSIIHPPKKTRLLLSRLKMPLFHQADWNQILRQKKSNQP